jgi:transcriptional/translational regulatory protein YebC/TACO1
MGRRAAKNAARKGKSDALKTKIYASYGKKLVMAVKAGGPEPDVNRALAVLIREAKAQGVPTDNVQRAIQRGKHV